MSSLTFDDQCEQVVLPQFDTLEDGKGAAVTGDDQLADVFALEVYREEIRRAEQLALDEAVAKSLYAKEEQRLLRLTDPDLDQTDSEDDVVLVNFTDLQDELECKPPPSCTCCLALLGDIQARRTLPCGHLYCSKCVATRCRMGVRDRALVPAHCCKKEFPTDYVREALSAGEFGTYERFLKEKHWRNLDLESDREYSRVVRQHHGVQCPGCGVGVQKTIGCNRMMCLNHHEFCFLCGAQWKTCACSYY